jgi:hypothetical protein
MAQVPPSGGSPAGYSCSDLEADARYRLSSGCGLYGKNKKLPAGMSPEYARLILLRVCGMFHEMSGFDSRFILESFSGQEKDLLCPLFNVDLMLKSLPPAKR